MENDLNLEAFADKLMQEKDFSTVSDPEVLVQIKEDLVQSLEENINAMVLAEMPPEKLEEFDRLTDQEGNDEEIANFIATNIPDLQNKLVQALVNFRNSYLGV